MSDEWRLTAELDGDVEAVERLLVDVRGRLSGAGRLTRDGQTLRVYSESEADAARAEALVLKLLERSPLGYELWHDRWDGEEGDWEEIAPDLPPGEEPFELDEAVEGDAAPTGRRRRSFPARRISPSSRGRPPRWERRTCSCWSRSPIASRRRHCGPG